MQNIFRCFCGTVKLRRILLAIVVGLCLGGIPWFSVKYYIFHTEIMPDVEDRVAASFSPEMMKKTDKTVRAQWSMGVLRALNENKKEKALWSLDLSIDGGVYTSWLCLQEIDEQREMAFLKTVKELRENFPRTVLPESDDSAISSEVDMILKNAANLEALYDLKDKKEIEKDFGNESALMQQMASRERTGAIENLKTLKAIYEGNNEKAFSMLDVSIDNGVLAVWEFLQKHKRYTYIGDTWFLNQVKELRQQYTRVISSQLDEEKMQKRIEMANKVDKILENLDELKKEQKQK